MIWITYKLRGELYSMWTDEEQLKRLQSEWESFTIYPDGPNEYAWDLVKKSMKTTIKKVKWEAK